jgi:hypothetical protein
VPLLRRGPPRRGARRPTPPDLFDGKTFAELADGIAYAGQVGFDTMLERGRLAAEDLPNEIV